MQQKKDVKILIAESFKELAVTRPIEKITIREITDRAGVIRVTFYNHFQDKYELLEWICREELVNPIRILLWNDMEQEALTFLFNSILRNQEFYRHAAHMEGQNSFPDIILSCFREVLTEYLQENTGNRPVKYEWLTAERMGEIFAQSLTYVLIAWIRSGMQESPEDMVEMYMYVATHSMSDIRKEFWSGNRPENS